MRKRNLLEIGLVAPTKSASEFKEAMCDNPADDFILFLLVSVRVD